MPFAGLVWFPEIDCYKLNISSLHFSKKKRGRLPDNLVKYEGSFGMSIDEFTPKNLTRRMCTSVSARKFDLLGKAAPLDLWLLEPFSWTRSKFVKIREFLEIAIFDILAEILILRYGPNFGAIGPIFFSAV